MMAIFKFQRSMLWSRAIHIKRHLAKLSRLYNRLHRSHAREVLRDSSTSGFKGDLAKCEECIHLRHSVSCLSGISYLSPLAHQGYHVIKSGMKKARKARNWIRRPCASNLVPRVPHLTALLFPPRSGGLEDGRPRK